MTKSGIGLIPFMLRCPDRWQYRFDGQKVEAVEEFDEISEGELEITIKLMEQMGLEVKREGNTLTLTRQATQEEAIDFSLNEFIGQGAALGLIPRALQAAFYEELIRRFKGS